MALLLLSRLRLLVPSRRSRCSRRDRVGSSTPKLHSDTIDPDNILKAAFELSARTMTSNVLDDELNTTANVLERLLWRRVLEARLKLMQDYLLLKKGPNTKDQGAPLDLDTGSHKHCKSPKSAGALSYKKGYYVV